MTNSLKVRSVSGVWRLMTVGKIYEKSRKEGLIILTWKEYY